MSNLRNGEECRKAIVDDIIQESLAAGKFRRKTDRSCIEAKFVKRLRGIQP